MSTVFQHSRARGQRLQHHGPYTPRCSGSQTEDPGTLRSRRTGVHSAPSGQQTDLRPACLSAEGLRAQAWWTPFDLGLRKTFRAAKIAASPKRCAAAGRCGVSRASAQPVTSTPLLSSGLEARAGTVPPFFPSPNPHTGPPLRLPTRHSWRWRDNCIHAGKVEPHRQS
jgi:hypothetical protein